MGNEAGRLIFWKPRAADLSDPAAVLDSLREGGRPKALDDLDTEAVLSALKRTYRAFKPPQPVELDFPKEETAITITWSPKHFSFYFEGVAFKELDRVLVLMSKLGLACYDALAGEMFSADAPPRFIGSPDEEARSKMAEKVMMDLRDAVFAEMGFPFDRKRGHSPGLRELERSHPERAKALYVEYRKRVTAAHNSPDFDAEVDRRMSLRGARPSKKRAQK